MSQGNWKCSTKWVSVLLVNVVVVAALLGLLEGAFRLLEISSDRGYMSHEEFRSTRPEPYQESPYWSKEFLMESFVQPDGWTTPAGTRLVLPNDFRGKWINVRQNLRVTEGQPSSAKGHVYLFGGSTVYGGEVPDEFTIASQLQKLLTDAGVPLSVVNLGATSVNSAQQVERLKTSVHPTNDDIIVFYDGVNDVLNGVWYGDPEGWIVGQIRDQAPFGARVIRRLSRESAVMRWIDMNVVSAASYAFPEATVKQVSNLYIANLIDGKKFADSRGAMFLHFLQPNLATKVPLTPYEKRLITLDGEIVPKGILAAYSTTYPLFRERLSNVSWSTDLTSVLNKLTLSPYLDHCHVTEQANTVIAEAIFARLMNELESRGKSGHQ